MNRDECFYIGDASTPEEVLSNHLKAQKKRYVCTSAAPWTPEMGNSSAHPDAVVTKEADDIAFSTGNYTHYHCPNCGIDFKVQEADY
jgi:hypothetical protein